MKPHRPCQGCLDGCAAGSLRHCISCVAQDWPCDAHLLRSLLMAASSDAHGRHGGNGTSYLDCSWSECTARREAILSTANVPLKLGGES